MPKAHIIVLDLHGEYCWKPQDGVRRYAFSDTIVRHVDARELEIPYWLMTYAELCDLLVERGEREARTRPRFSATACLKGDRLRTGPLPRR